MVVWVVDVAHTYAPRSSIERSQEYRTKVHRTTGGPDDVPTPGPCKEGDRGRSET